MASTHGPVIPLRRVIAGALLFLGGFMIFFGLGYGVNMAIIVLGLAMMVLAATLRLVSSLRGGVPRWVTGTGHVVEVTEAPPSSAYGRCELQLIVKATGMLQEAVMVRDPRVPVEKWPYPGIDLPIEVAVNDIRNVRIQWDEVAPHGDPADEAWDDWDQADAPPGLRRRPDDTIEIDLDAGPHPRPGQATATATAPRPPRADPGAGVGFQPTMATPPPDAADLPRRMPQPRPSSSSRPTPPPRSESRMAQAAAITATPTARSGPDTTTSSAAAAATVTSAATATATPSASVDGLIAGDPGPPSGAIHGVGITMLVADLGRSVAFYRDKLGFHEVDGGENSTVLASGETRVVLRSTREFGPVNRRLVHLNLVVNDIQAVYQELKAKGVRFTYAPRPVNRGTRLELLAAAFKDPDGHGIAITQWRTREPG